MKTIHLILVILCFLAARFACAQADGGFESWDIRGLRAVFSIGEAANLLRSIPVNQGCIDPQIDFGTIEDLSVRPSASECAIAEKALAKVLTKDSKLLPEDLGRFGSRLKDIDAMVFAFKCRPREGAPYQHYLFEVFLPDKDDTPLPGRVHMNLYFGDVESMPSLADVYRVVSRYIVVPPFEEGTQQPGFRRPEEITGKESSPLIQPITANWIRTYSSDKSISDEKVARELAEFPRTRQINFTKPRLSIRGGKITLDEKGTRRDTQYLTVLVDVPLEAAGGFESWDIRGLEPVYSPGEAVNLLKGISIPQGCIEPQISFRSEELSVTPSASECALAKKALAKVLTKDSKLLPEDIGRFGLRVKDIDAMVFAFKCRPREGAPYQHYLFEVFIPHEHDAQPEPVHMNLYFGDVEPMPSLGDVYRVASRYIVVPPFEEGTQQPGFRRPEEITGKESHPRIKPIEAMYIRGLCPSLSDEDIARELAEFPRTRQINFPKPRLSIRGGKITLDEKGTRRDTQYLTIRLDVPVE